MERETTDPRVLLSRGIAHMKDGQKAKGERLIRDAFSIVEGAAAVLYGAQSELRMDSEEDEELRQSILEQTRAFAPGVVERAERGITE